MPACSYALATRLVALPGDIVLRTNIAGFVNHLPGSANALTDTLETPLLNQKHLDELRALDTGDGSTFARLVQTYCDEARTQVSALHTALHAADYSAVIQVSHRLRGSSANFGAVQLASLCSQIEVAVRAGNLSAAQELEPQLTHAVTLTLLALSHLYALDDGAVAL